MVQTAQQISVHSNKIVWAQFQRKLSCLTLVKSVLHCCKKHTASHSIAPYAAQSLLLYPVRTTTIPNQPGSMAMCVCRVRTVPWPAACEGSCFEWGRYTLQGHMCQLVRFGQSGRSVLPPFSDSQEAGWRARGTCSFNLVACHNRTVTVSLPTQLHKYRTAGMHSHVRASNIACNQNRYCLAPKDES